MHDTESPHPLSDAGEVVFPLHDARKHLPVKISRDSLLRWIEQGIKSASGKVVCLEAEKHGAHWYTSRDAYRRFHMRLKE